MEDWTEATLIKLSVKELKLLARKSRPSVNPNSKKAELVKALLTNNDKDTAIQSETMNPNEAQSSRRMTRSRVSIWQTSDGTSDFVKESISKMKDLEGNLNSEVKDSVNEKRIRRKQEKTAENIDVCNTAEMFPLVSSIQLASKPLLEITNKEMMINEHYKHDEFRAGATSKRPKQNKVKSKNIEEILPSTVKGVNIVASATHSSSTAENNDHKDCDLNSTFIIEEKISGARPGNRGSKEVKPVELPNEKDVHSPIQPVEKIIVDKSYNKSVDVERMGETEQSKSNLVTVDKREPGKSKKGKKRKPESPVENERQAENTTVHYKSSENSNTVSITCFTHVHEKSPVKQKFNDISNSKGLKGRNTPISENVKQNLDDDYQVPSKASKKRRKKHNGKGEDDSSIEVTQNVENSIIQGISEVIDKLPETPESEMVQRKNIDSSETKPNDSKKRKRRNNSPKETKNINESNFSDGDQIKSKRKKVAQPNKINVLSSPDISVRDKLNISKKKMQESSLKNETSKTQEPSESAESPLSYCSGSRRTRSIPEFQNVSTIVKDNVNGSVSKSTTKEQKTSIENSMDVKDISLAEGETGTKSVQAPIRSSTFILSDSGITEEVQEMPVPVRGSTFLLSETDRKSLQRKSLRFSPESALEKKSTSNQNAPKLGKSIGKRIMQSSNMKRINEKTLKKDPGSALKKTLVKSTTPGSVFKKRPANKMPDFKKIHQQLFSNMESLSENKKRQLNRAQGLLQSPIVPRCALVSPKNARPESSPLSKVQDGKINSPSAPSPLASKLKTPVLARTPRAPQKPTQVASSVNRFGFRRPLKKEEATRIIGSKLPTINVEKKKEQGRNLLQGVRMNKRFILQMQMRQNSKGQ